MHFVPYIRPAPQGAPRPNPHPGHARAPALSRPMDHALMRTHPIQLAGTVRADSEDLAGADFYVRRDDVAVVPREERVAGVWNEPAEQSAQFGTLAAGAAELNRPSAERLRRVAIECDIVDREHRMPRGPRAPEFRTDADRAAYHIEKELSCLVPLMPYTIVLNMLGGELGRRQVPSQVGRDNMIKQMLRKRAGSEGDRLASVRNMLRDVRKYAITELGVPRDKADLASFPMSGAMAHALIAKAHAEAVQRGNGSKGGSTVGHHLRETIVFAAEKLLWPIEVPRVVLESAAPKAHMEARTRAGTLPIAAKCQLEMIARGTRGLVTVQDPTDPQLPLTVNILDLNQVPQAARAAVVFYARSLLAGGIDHSVRIGEGVRVDLWPDEHDPLHVMRGNAHMGKDGAPVDIYAPATGFLGDYEWYPDHLVQCHETGITFPAWVKPHGSRGVIERSGGIKEAIAEKKDVRLAFKALLQMKPLSYTDEELEEMNIQGHSGHASAPDWARAFGENITMEVDPPLPPEVAKGFSEPEIDLLGHWLRTAETKDESRASAAAASAPPGMARRAAAIAIVKEKARTAHKMRNYYGMGGLLANRFSERIRQLAARHRLMYAVKATLRGKTWHALPRGQLDILHLIGGTPMEQDE